MNLFDSPMPRVYAMPTIENFTLLFAKFLLNEYENLREITILLPTQRSCVGFKETLAELTNKTIFLPKLISLSEYTENDKSLEKLSIITRLIKQELPSISTAEAFHLAISLSSLINELILDEINYDIFEKIFPDTLTTSKHLSIDVLKRLIINWSEIGFHDPTYNKLKTISQIEKSLIAIETPIFAIGSTGAIPSVARLLKFISERHNGCVILPGFEKDLRSELPDHPQSSFYRLLNFMNITHESVLKWPINHNKLNYLTKEVTAALTQRSKSNPELFNSVTLIECNDSQEEANVISLILRSIIENPDKKVALVTPDLKLSKRVSASLLKWGLQVTQSRGIPLSSTPIGIFARLVIEAIISKFELVPTFALLKHPGSKFKEKLSPLELWLRSLLHIPQVMSRILTLYQGGEFLNELSNIIIKANQLIETPSEWEFNNFLTIHINVLNQIINEELLQSDENEQFINFVEELKKLKFPMLSPKDYVDIFTNLLSMETVYKKSNFSRIIICGPLEARFINADVLILAGLNEGTWPKNLTSQPWLNRFARQAVGLTSLERNVGLSAQDFIQSFSASEVFLTRSQTSERSPETPSRWLMYLHSYLGDDVFSNIKKRGEYWLKLSQSIDTSLKFCPTNMPNPKPPVELRPKKLSVTEIGLLMRDPYSIYAKHILGLKILYDFEGGLFSILRGHFVHKVLEFLVKNNVSPNKKEILQVGEKIAISLGVSKEEFGFWKYRFERIAEWISTEFQKREPNILKTIAEARGELDLSSITLVCVADRVEILKNGNIIVTDYKTGSIPQMHLMDAGYSPQLPLEAGIAINNGFNEVDSSNLLHLEIWKLTGGNPPGEISIIDCDVIKRAKKAISGLNRILKTFEKKDVGYPSWPKPSVAPPYDKYAHLARVKEWLILNESFS